MAQLFMARENAWVEHDGEPTLLEAGRTLAREGHPILDKHADLFIPAVVRFDVYDDEADPPADDPPAEPKPKRTRAAAKS